jgi:hypothetical protein
MKLTWPNIKLLTLRVFNCLCYATNVTPDHKFDMRAFLLVIYPLGKKRYQVYDRETRKFLTSQDVAFHEHIFPFSTMTHAI